MENELKGLPCGSLRCTSNKGTDQFYVNGKYMSKKQMNVVRGIAQRDYYEKLLPVIKKRLRILHEMELSYVSDEIENCFAKSCEARRKIITPVFETVEEKIHRFMEEEYEPGRFDNDNTTEFFTLKGERVRSKSEVLISDCFAKDIFSNEEIEKTVYSEDIFAVTTNVGKKNNDAIHSNIRYLLSDINNELKAAKVWYIEYDKGRVSCQRIALFKSDKLIDVLDEETSKGILLIYGEAKNLSDSAKLNDCTISYKVSQAKSNVNVEIKNNKPVFSLNLDLDLDLYGADNIDRSDEIKAMLENRLASLQANAINFCIKKYGCDIFNFHRYIMNSDSKFFKANLSQMENIIQSADYNATIDIKVKYMGSNQKISSLVY